MIALSEIVKEEKCLVLDDRAANSAAKFMNLLNGFGKWTQVSDAAINRIATISFQNRMVSIERRILAVVITRAVKLIRPRFNRRADHRACRATNFCRWNACRYLKLCNRVGIWKHT